MPVYLTLDDVLSIHAELIGAFGGAGGLRDIGLVDSALLRPQTGHYIDLVEQAAAMWESLAMNHGFVDGNKRRICVRRTLSQPQWLRDYRQQ